MQANGRFARGGEFEGTITINKFQLDEDGKAIEAVGLVQGILRRGNRTIGTVLGGQVTLPVVLKAGNRPSPRAAPRHPLGPLELAGLSFRTKPSVMSFR